MGGLSDFALGGGRDMASGKLPLGVMHPCPVPGQPDQHQQALL